MVPPVLMHLLRPCCPSSGASGSGGSPSTSWGLDLPGPGGSSPGGPLRQGGLAQVGTRRKACITEAGVPAPRMGRGCCLLQGILSILPHMSFPSAGPSPFLPDAELPWTVPAQGDGPGESQAGSVHLSQVARRAVPPPGFLIGRKRGCEHAFRKCISDREAEGD